MPRQQAYDVNGIELLTHPAFVAWRAVRADAREPRTIAVLQEKSRGAVYRLDGAGPHGEAVIAKRAKHNLLEWRIHRKILSDLPLATAHCYGMLETPDDQTGSWLFLSAVAGDAASPLNPHHRILAAKWLAMLHTRAAAPAARLELPDRSDGYYLARLRSARRTLRESIEGLTLDGGQREVLFRSVGECDRIESHWDQVGRICGYAPFTLIHGDFAPKNVRVCDDTSMLTPFDWGSAGFGVIADDLAQPPHPTDPYWVSPDLQTYLDHVGDDFPHLDLPRLRALGHVGRIFRALVCLDKDAQSLRTPWVHRVFYKLDAYRQQLAEAARDLGWRGYGDHGASASNARSRKLPSTAALEAGLTTMLRGEGLADAVTVTARQSNPYASSFPSEFVTCTAHNGQQRELLVKYVDANIDTCYGHRGGADYEAMVYRHVLRPMNLGTPRFHGSLDQAENELTWFAVEKVHNCRHANQAAEPQLALCDAGRWIARFHAAAAVRDHGDILPLIRHDASYYRGWISRTRAFAAKLRDRYPWLDALCDRENSLIAPLLDEEQHTTIHGEFYPHNLLVAADGRIVPIDWQSTARASGTLDLAALTENWASDVVRAVVEAYVQTRWPGGAPQSFDGALWAARLHLHFRWLGDRPRWTLDPTSAWRFEQLRRAADEA